MGTSCGPSLQGEAHQPRRTEVIANLLEQVKAFRAVVVAVAASLPAVAESGLPCTAIGSGEGLQRFQLFGGRLVVFHVSIVADYTSVVKYQTIANLSDTVLLGAITGDVHATGTSCRIVRYLAT
jgi:hypothetical protein